MAEINKLVKRKRHDAVESIKKLKPSPAHHVNEGEEYKPLAAHTKKWYPVQACNLLGLSGGRARRSMPVPFKTFDAPGGEEYCMVQLNHRQSWLSTICGGPLKRCYTVFDAMRKKYKLRQTAETTVTQLPDSDAEGAAPADAGAVEDPVLSLFGPDSSAKQNAKEGIRSKK